MMNELRQRQGQEAHSSSAVSTADEIKIPKRARYKTLGRRVAFIGLLAIIAIGFVRGFRSIKSSLFAFDFSEEEFYPAEILHLFQKYDRDENHYLSLDEFEPLAALFLQKHLPSEYQQPILDTDQLVTINALFEPLNLSTMTKDFRMEFLVKRKSGETSLSERRSLILEQPR